MDDVDKSMMRNHPVPPQRILQQIQESHGVDMVSIPLSGQRFEQLLRNPDFARAAQTIIAEKIATLTALELPPSKRAAQQKMLQGWRRALNKASAALEGPGSPDVER